MHFEIIRITNHCDHHQFVNDYVQQTLKGAGEGVWNHLQQLLISSHIDKLLPLAKSGSAHKVTFLEVHPFPLNLWWKSYFSNYLLIQPHCGDGLTFERRVLR